MGSEGYFAGSVRTSARNMAPLALRGVGVLFLIMLRPRRAEDVRGEPPGLGSGVVEGRQSAAKALVAAQRQPVLLAQVRQRLHRDLRPRVCRSQRVPKVEIASGAPGDTVSPFFAAVHSGGDPRNGDRYVAGRRSSSSGPTRLARRSGRVCGPRRLDGSAPWHSPCTTATRPAALGDRLADRLQFLALLSRQAGRILARLEVLFQVLPCTVKVGFADPLKGVAGGLGVIRALRLRRPAGGPGRGLHSRRRDRDGSQNPT